MHKLPAAALSLLLPSSFAAAQPSFELLGRYTTGLADVAEEVTAGETAVLKHGRLYVTNADDISVDIVDVRNPKRPKLLKRVDLSAYGETVNSVDVSKLHLIAAAVDGFGGREVIVDAKLDKAARDAATKAGMPLAAWLRLVASGSHAARQTRFPPTRRRWSTARPKQSPCDRRAARERAHEATVRHGRRAHAPRRRAPAPRGS